MEQPYVTSYNPEQVSDLDERYLLISDSQDRQAVLEAIGLEAETPQWPHLFVWVEDGDYVEVWGCYSDPPLNDSPVVRLLPRYSPEPPPDDPGEWVEWWDLEGLELPED